MHHLLPPKGDEGPGALLRHRKVGRVVRHEVDREGERRDQGPTETNQSAIPRTPGHSYEGKCVPTSTVSCSQHSCLCDLQLGLELCLQGKHPLSPDCRRKSRGTKTLNKRQ